MVTQYCAEYAVTGRPDFIMAYTLVRDAKWVHFVHAYNVILPIKYNYI